MDEKQEPAGLDRPAGSEQKERELARAVREACVRAALEAYELAGLSGLCDEGRWEMAIDSIRSLDLDTVLQELKS